MLLARQTDNYLIIIGHPIKAHEPKVQSHHKFGRRGIDSARDMPKRNAVIVARDKYRMWNIIIIISQGASVR